MGTGLYWNNAANIYNGITMGYYEELFRLQLRPRSFKFILQNKRMPVQHNFDQYTLLLTNGITLDWSAVP